MKEIVYLNQAKSIEFGFKNVQCAAIFTVIADLIEKNKDGIELNEIAKQLPLLNLQPDTIKGYIDDLEKKNVLVRQKNTGKKHIIELTESGKKYFEVKEKNQDNEIFSLVDDFIGKIAKKFFLLSEVWKKDLTKYNDELPNLIDSLAKNGVYELYFEKLRSFIYIKYYSYKFEISPQLTSYKDFIGDYAKDREIFLAAMRYPFDPLESHQGNFNHPMEMMCMFYREKYLNRKI